MLETMEDDNKIYEELISSPQIPVRNEYLSDSPELLSMMQFPLLQKNESSDHSSLESPTCESIGKRKDNFRQSSAVSITRCSDYSYSPVKRKFKSKDSVHKLSLGDQILSYLFKS